MPAFCTRREFIKSASAAMCFPPSFDRNRGNLRCTINVADRHLVYSLYQGRLGLSMRPGEARCGPVERRPCPP